jgi:hypothetical protein
MFSSFKNNKLINKLNHCNPRNNTLSRKSRRKRRMRRRGGGRGRGRGRFFFEGPLFYFHQKPYVLA